MKERLYIRYHGERSIQRTEYHDLNEAWDWAVQYAGTDLFVLRECGDGVKRHVNVGKVAVLR